MPAGTGSRPASSTCRSMAAATCCSTTTPTPEGIAAIAAAHRRFGTTALLPTLISDTPRDDARGQRRGTDRLARDPGVLGIHFEGPFLSPASAGVHDPAMIRRPTTRRSGAPDRAARSGATLVTLAPEARAGGLHCALHDAGVRVSLGHSMATYAQTRAALARRSHRLHPSVQRHAAAGEPRARADRGGAGDAARLLRRDRRRGACRPAMLRLALRGAATRRCSSPTPCRRWAAPAALHPQRPRHHRAGRPLRRRRRHARRGRRSTWRPRCATS